MTVARSLNSASWQMGGCHAAKFHRERPATASRGHRSPQPVLGPVDRDCEGSPRPQESNPFLFAAGLSFQSRQIRPGHLCRLQTLPSPGPTAPCPEAQVEAQGVEQARPEPAAAPPGPPRLPSEMRKPAAQAGALLAAHPALSGPPARAGVRLPGPQPAAQAPQLGAGGGSCLPGSREPQNAAPSPINIY